MKRFDTYLGRIAAAAILLVTGGFLSSCDKNDDGPKLDKITVSVSEVNATATTAVFIGVVERESKAPADAIVGFEYAKSEDFSDATEVTVLEDEFSEKVTGLSTNTKYYYRTFVEKKGQRTYGDVRDFTTSSVSASVETIATSSTKAEIVCLVDPEVAGSASLKAGVEVSLDETFAEVEDIAAETISEDGEYTISMEDLTLNTYYYVRPYIEEGGNRIYGTVKAFATTGVNFALNVTLETALLRVFGSVEVDEADMNALTVGYQVSTDPEFSEADTTTVVIPADQYGNYDSGNKFNYRKPSTDYYYRSYVLAGGVYYYNNISKHTTDALALLAYQLKNVTATSASCMPAYNSNGWDLTGVDEAGDAYSTDENFLTSGNGVTHVAMQDDPYMPGLGFYSISISGLTPATGYYYTYYIKRGEEYEYGPAESVLSFVTLPDASCISVNEVKPTINPGQVTFTGSSNISDIARTTYAITTSLEYATTEDFSDKVSESFTGNLSFQKDDLKPATTYYYRIALAYNDGKNDKTLYTDVKSFTTDEIALTCNMSTIKETSMTASMSIGYSGWDISGLEFGVILSTDSDCSLSSSDVINKPSGMLDLGGGMLIITSSFSDLTPGTTYYYRGYIKRNGEYAHWTEIKSATTKITYPSAAFVKVEEMNTNLNIHLNVNDWNNEDKFVTGIQYGFSSDLSDGTNKKINRSTDISQDAQWLVQVPVGVPSIRVYYRFYYAPVSDQNNCNYGNILHYDMPDLDPSLLTITLGEVTTSTASFSGAFGGIFDANACLWDVTNSKIQFGVICSTSENATIDTPDVVNVEMTAAKGFLNDELQSATATGLAEGTTYYYRSYYKVGETVVYLHNGTFTTTSAPKTVNISQADLFTFGTNTSASSPKTLTFSGVDLEVASSGGGTNAETYYILLNGSTPYIKIKAPKPITSVVLDKITCTSNNVGESTPCVVGIYSSIGESPVMLDSYSISTKSESHKVEFTLDGTVDEVYVQASLKSQVTGISVTY